MILLQGLHPIQLSIRMKPLHLPFLAFRAIIFQTLSPVSGLRSIPLFRTWQNFWRTWINRRAQRACLFSVVIRRMDVDEQRILGYYASAEHRILKTFQGEEAWKYILLIRYGPRSRPCVRRSYAGFDKTNSFLVVFVFLQDGNPTEICSHFYLNKQDTTSTPSTGEGQENMFDHLPYEYVNLPDTPKIIQKLIEESSS